MAYIETSGFRGGTKRMKPFEDPLVWALQAVPLLIIGGAVGWRRRQDYLAGDRDGVRRRGALSVAGRRLKKASALSQGGDADAFYAELSLALRGFFGDKLSRPSAGLRIDEVHAALLERKVDQALADEAARLLEESDSARFSPASGDPQRMRQALDHARELIEKLNRAI